MLITSKARGMTVAALCLLALFMLSVSLSYLVRVLVIMPGTLSPQKEIYVNAVIAVRTVYWLFWFVIAGFLILPFYVLAAK